VPHFDIFLKCDAQLESKEGNPAVVILAIHFEWNAPFWVVKRLAALIHSFDEYERHYSAADKIMAHKLRRNCLIRRPPPLNPAEGFEGTKKFRWPPLRFNSGEDFYF
jgi:hypothetical protein